MPNFIEEIVYYLANKRYPNLSATAARDRLQVELKKESGSRILNNLNTIEFNTDLHAFDRNKYDKLMALFDQASKSAIKNGKLEEGILTLDPVSEASLRSWIDAIVLEGCEMLLDDSGHLRKDVISYLGLKAEEKELNRTNHFLQSFVQHMTEEISIQWFKENVDKVESRQAAIDVMSQEQKRKNEQAALNATVFNGMQYFFDKYFKDEKYISAKVNEHVISLTYNIPAKCAGELKEISNKMTPAAYQKALKSYILADLQHTSALENKEKLEFWLDVISFSAGNGDYNSLAAFIDLCEKQPIILQELSETRLSQYISCRTLFEYYQRGIIPLQVSMQAKEEKINSNSPLQTVDQWIHARNNSHLIDLIMQKYHKQEKLPQSNQDIRMKEQVILRELANLKFEEGLLTSTTQFLADLSKKVGKEGKLAAIISNFQVVDKFGNNKSPASQLFKPKPAQTVQHDSIVAEPATRKRR